MNSLAVVCPKRSERSIMRAVAGSKLPDSAEVRTREPSSCAERAEASSSAGSMPRRRTNQLAEAFMALMNQEMKALNQPTGRTTRRAVCRGRVIAAFLGTSSPKTIDRVVATISASTRATVEEASSPRPRAPSSGVK